MTVTREDLNPCTVLLTVTLTAEEVSQGFQRAFKTITKNIKLPGFRPGHAPKAMLEQLVPDDQLADEAANQIIRNTIKGAISSQELVVDPTTRPSADFKRLDREAGEGEYTLKVPLPPKIELGDFTNLEVASDPVVVTDEDVDFQIDEFRKRRSTRESVTDRGLAEGDVAVVKIQRDGESDAKTFMIIAGKSFPALDAALTGMHVEEQKHVELEFPADFQEEAWRNTTAKVLVTLSSLSAVKLPEVDDDFAQSLQTENAAELRERVKSGLAAAKENMAFEVATDKLLNDLLDKSQIHVSDNMWEALADRRIRDTAEELAQRGETLEQYVKDQGMSLDEFVANWRERAQFEVRRALIIQTIFTNEKLGLTNADLNQELMLLSGELGVEPAELVKALQKDSAMDELQFRAIQRKVRQFLLSKAKIVESGAAPVEAPKRERKAKSDKTAEAAEAPVEAGESEEAAKPEPKPKAAKKPAKKAE